MIPLFLSITCSTLLLVIFKLFDRFKINNLHAIVVNYFVATSTGIFLSWNELNLTDIFIQDWTIIAMMIGVLFISLFVIIAISSQTAGIAVTSVANKMSMIIPVIAAVYLYGDEINYLKSIGIILATAGVILCTFSRKNKGIKNNKAWVYPVIIFFGSGLADTLVKYSEHSYLGKGQHAGFPMLIFASAAIAGILLLLNDIAIRKIKFERKSIWWGIILGVPNYFSIYFLLLTLSQPGWQSSMVYPVNNMGIVVASAIAGILFFREKMTKQIVTGLILSVLAIYLIFISQTV